MGPEGQPYKPRHSAGEHPDEAADIAAAQGKWGSQWMQPETNDATGKSIAADAQRETVDLSRSEQPPGRHEKPTEADDAQAPSAEVQRPDFVASAEQRLPDSEHNDKAADTKTGNEDDFENFANTHPNANRIQPPEDEHREAA